MYYFAIIFKALIIKDIKYRFLTSKIIFRKCKKKSTFFLAYFNFMF